MRTKTKTALAAVLVFGSASLALADDGTDGALDTSRNSGPLAQQQIIMQQRLTTRPVALPRTHLPATSDEYINRPSRVLDGGGG
jgi:hypothetical protein